MRLRICLMLSALTILDCLFGISGVSSATLAVVVLYLCLLLFVCCCLGILSALCCFLILVLCVLVMLFVFLRLPGHNVYNIDSCNCVPFSFLAGS